MLENFALNDAVVEIKKSRKKLSRIGDILNDWQTTFTFISFESNSHFYSWNF